MKTKNFNVRGCRWNEIEKSSLLGSDKVTISRPVTRTGLKKGGGQMVTKIDVKRSELPKKYQKILRVFT